MVPAPSVPEGGPEGLPPPPGSPDDRPDPIIAALDAPEPPPPPPDDLALAGEPRNDLGNARRLIARHGHDLTYIDGVDWHVFDGRRWDGEAGKAEAMKRAHATSEAIRAESEALRKDAHDRRDADEEKSGAWDKERAEKWAAALEDRVKAHARFGVGSGNAGKTKAMLEQAQPYLRRSIAAMDRHLFLFNAENCTLDLERAPAERLGFRRGNLITKIAAVRYDPEASCPRWLALLARALPDPQERGFLQRYFGYALTGSIEEQALLVLYGEGSNGKSSIVTVIGKILGDYALTLDISTLLASEHSGGGGQATPDLARLPGKRLAMASEPDKGDRLSEKRVKSVTGGEALPIRNLFEKQIEIDPQFKLVISCNHKPRIIGQDEGIWRRVLMLHFRVIIPKAERDKRLPAKLLREEGPGILNWLIDGCMAWQERGLDPPASVLEATAEYRSENDPLGAFLAGETIKEAGASVQAKVIYDAYAAWCTDNGQDPITSTKFGTTLGDRGISKSKAGVMFYRGIRMLTMREREAAQQAAVEAAAAAGAAAGRPDGPGREGLEGRPAHPGASPGAPDPDDDLGGDG
jgi:putative DNA primase/helicase